MLGLLTLRASAQVTVDTVLTNGLFEPYGVVVDANNAFYLTDSANHRVVHFDPNTGIASTVAGIPGESGNNDGPPYLAHLNSPQGIAMANVNGVAGLLIADTGNHTIRFINLANGNVSTIAGRPSIAGSPANAFGTNATFRSPVGLAVDSSGILFVADSLNNAIRVIDLADPAFGVTNLVIAGTSLRQPNDIAISGTNQLWIADTRNHAVKLVTRTGTATATLTTVMGSNDQNIPGANDNQFGASARFNQPRGLLNLGAAGLVIADTANQTVRLATNNPVFGSTNYAVITLAGIPGQSGFVNGPALSAKFSGPHGLARDSLGSGFLVADTANNAIRRIQTGPTLPPVNSPRIGWVDFVKDGFGDLVSFLVTDQPFVFNNDVTIAILAEAGTETFFTYGPTPPSPVEDNIPSPNRFNGATPPPYENGLHEFEVPTSIISPAPDVTIKAIGTQDGRQSSPVTQARFQFKTGNPIISGDNAAGFTVETVTTGADMWYTTDGTTPTNSAPSTPVTGIGVISLIATNDLTFKIRAFRTGYKDSDIVTKVFSPTNFIPNRISFGFQNGEASSEFVASAGQTFYAPVTLSVLQGAVMYSLQFNASVTNVTGPAVAPGAVEFSSMLQAAVPPLDGNKLPPGSAQWFRTIPTWAFDHMEIVTDTNGNVISTFPVFNDLRFTNNAYNLMGIGWAERWGFANLYDTFIQDLIEFSIARDTLFDKSDGKVVLGAFGFTVPDNAPIGTTYRIVLGRPSATSDGVGAPGSDVYIDNPQGGPLSALKTVTVGQRKYIVGDAAPFRWLNAGDFGNTNLFSDDFMQVFETTIYNFETNDPPRGSDLFDAMDSCCGTAGSQIGSVYYQAGGSTAVSPTIFDGNDTSINGYPFGDGVLDVTDIFVTFRRSLDCSLAWFQRYHTASGLAAEAVPNQFRGDTNCPTPPAPIPPPAPAQSTAAVDAEIRFSAGDGISASGQTILVPITAKIRGNYPLRVIGLGINVQGLDGAPDLTTPITFSPVSTLGAPTMSSSRGPGNYSAAWLNNGIAGLTGEALVGTLHITLPPNCPSNAAYVVTFQHASGSPNGLGSFPRKVWPGLVTLRDRSGSSRNDGISDAWRLRYFGTIHDTLSQASADADGDGANNAQECKAGTNPNDATSALKAQVNGQRTIRWPSAPGKQYVIERSSSVYSPAWSSVATNVGTGWDMEYTDATPGSGARFYRVRVQ